MEGKKGTGNKQPKSISGYTALDRAHSSLQRWVHRYEHERAVCQFNYTRWHSFIRGVSIAWQRKTPRPRQQQQPISLQSTQSKQSLRREDAFSTLPDGLGRRARCFALPGSSRRVPVDQEHGART